MFGCLINKHIYIYRYRYRYRYRYKTPFPTPTGNTAGRGPRPRVQGVHEVAGAGEPVHTRRGAGGTHQDHTF